MNQLLTGALLIVLGITLVLVYNKTSKTQKEDAAIQKPYLKNVGLGFILFGVYYLAKYFVR